jgi:hypothetical protein
MLEQKEKERVMKLMDRLENMKRNATQSNTCSANKCSLCGDYFYSLRSLPNQCSHCKKILCSKCCVDTPGAASSGTGECSSNNGSRRNSYSSNSGGNEASGGGSNRGGTSVVYLCRLCSEQREVCTTYSVLLTLLKLLFFLT